MRPTVSIIVPVLFDADAAGRLLAQIRPDPAVEVVLVDGAGEPALEALARRHASVRVICTPNGRARQMNTGAAATTGEWLLFLHADSRLPDGWHDALAACPPRVAGAWFRFALDDTAWQARVIEWGVRWRVRLLRLPYGDQGLAVRRETFTALGGFADMPLLEDVDFVRRLARTRACIEIPLPLATSSRRWRQDGWARRTARNLAIITFYFAGVSPSRLARWYAPRATRNQ